MAIFTFGHSTLSETAFADSLRGKITTLIDVRSHPGSRWPQFNRESMEKWLPEFGIKYEWWPELGGWDKRHAPLSDEMEQHDVDVASYVKGKFPKQRIAQNTLPKTPTELTQLSLSCCKPEWTNTGLRDYSWFETLEEFLKGADKLIVRGEEEDIAIMCCEVQYWRCHRSMISDHLAFRGVESLHIMPRMRQRNKIKFVDGVRITRHSSVLGNRLERYEDQIIRSWEKWTGKCGRSTDLVGQKGDQPGLATPHT